MFGHDIAGTHYNPAEKILTPENISRLKPKWIFETGGDVSSQPIVVNGIVYFGSWDGKEYAVDSFTGKKIWEYDCGIPARASAAYDNGIIYFGDLSGRLYAVEARSGTLKWSERIDPHPKAVVTSSPKVYQGRIYIGVSSHEEGEPRRQKNYPCCSFRGGVAAFDARTGKQVWRFYTIPEEPRKLSEDASGRVVFGPAGIAVWCSVGLDSAANRIYFTTGNQYSGADTKLVDSIVALTMDTGKQVWSYQARPSDVFVVGCRDCGPDFDFGTTPLPVKGPGGGKILAAGTKEWMGPRRGRRFRRTGMANRNRSWERPGRHTIRQRNRRRPAVRGSGASHERGGDRGARWSDGQDFMEYSDSGQTAQLWPHCGDRSPGKSPGFRWEHGWVHPRL